MSGGDAARALDHPVDPVGDAAGYQALLVGLVGDRDPAEVQEELGDELERLVREAGPHLRTRPRPGEWSVLECLGHILDAEVGYAWRYRLTLAHDQPPMMGYDQDLWVERLRHNEADPEALLELFRALRRSHLDLWRRSSEEERGRVGIHAERGPESYDLSFRMIAGHGLLHLAQMERTLTEVTPA